MMKPGQCTTSELLGLPSPANSEIRDEEMLFVYESFLNQLELVANAKVILSNPYELEINSNTLSAQKIDWRTDLSRKECKKMLFLSLISRPMDASTLWPKGQPKITDAELFNLLWPTPNRLSLSDAKGEIPFGVETLPGLIETLSDPGLARLFAQVPSRKEVITISAEMVGWQPGNYDHQMWQVAKWSTNWAVVFGVTDAGGEGYSFPWLLGFICTDDMERNFVSLLYEGTKRFDPGFYYTDGHVFSHWLLARLALAGCDGGVDWETVLDLVPLEDSVLEALIGFEEDPENNRLIRRIIALDDLTNSAELGELSVAELIQMVGKGSSLSQIEQYLVRAIDEL
jgi:hypothetical protein